MKRTVGFFILSLLGTVAVALAGSPPILPPVTTPAPEIDPAGAFAALTLLAGTLAVLRGRRSRK